MAYNPLIKISFKSLKASTYVWMICNGSALVEAGAMQLFKR